MPNLSDYPAAGKLLAINEDSVVFQPQNTTYELQLVAKGPFPAKVGQRTQCLIHAPARKLYSVRSGGSFIVPIFGPPRIVQGRIKFLDEKQMVVQAGAPIVVDLPSNDTGYDMECGPLAVGRMVNVVCLPGARIDSLAPEAVG